MRGRSVRPLTPCNQKDLTNNCLSIGDLAASMNVPVHVFEAFTKGIPKRVLVAGWVRGHIPTCEKRRKCYTTTPSGPANLTPNRDGPATGALSWSEETVPLPVPGWDRQSEVVCDVRANSGGLFDTTHGFRPSARTRRLSARSASSFMSSPDSACMCSRRRRRAASTSVWRIASEAVDPSFVQLLAAALH